MRISNKFDVPSIYDNGRYYFPKDVEPLKDKDGYKIQVIYYRGKWRQDTLYTTIGHIKELITFYNNKMKTRLDIEY